MKHFSSVQRNLKALFGGPAVEVKAEPSALDPLTGQTTSAEDSVQNSTISATKMLTQKELDLLHGSGDTETKPTFNSLFFTADSIKKERLDQDLSNLSAVGSHKLLPMEITHKNASLSDGNKLSPETLIPHESNSQLNADGLSLKALSAKTTPVNMRERNAMLPELPNCSPFNLPYPGGKFATLRLTSTNPSTPPILTTRQYGKDALIHLSSGTLMRVVPRENSGCDLCTLYPNHITV